ncbi:leucyl/phenylalanyl-tRNA--protein transferase [Zhouia amylolytica]|uniref:Leucyl/phenylalanyl-tRNA--protein transferase n=1 Tax=Zhouia amylolytica AD3 TaxID=1286632 RepID=W2UKA3_9FLAO|nr:leucyl/phenylalanyl-tRNA--protein transferase [Zhouia amylolytica]ETN94590.1 leucyl/phenylalanyl-tRNA--protein transferase [Zhouia amylolytica AD3]
MFFLSDKIEFPALELASSDGLLAVGGDLSPERLIYAYQHGIFPWFDEGSMILWWSPDPRMVLYPDRLRLSKSMRQILRSGKFRVTYNQNFEEVVRNCSTIKRKGEDGTWITNEMITAYKKLHDLGYAKSVEVWNGNHLVGGLYGVDLGHVFCGESMFSKESNASKVAFISLVKDLMHKNYQLIDCQVYTDHLASLGAEEIPRDEFLKVLNKRVKG